MTLSYLVSLCGLRFCVLTYMGCYNHDLEKGTHLKTNMATVEDMRRRMTKAERNRIKAGCDGVKAQWSQMNALFHLL